MRQRGVRVLRTVGSKGLTLAQIAILVVAGLMPALTSQTASAAQLTSRRSTISTSRGDATGVSYQFNFTLASAIDVEGIIFEFCTTPLGTCTLPPGMDVDFGTAGVSATQTFTTTSQLFAEVTSTTGDCTITGSGDTKYCVNRTMATAEAADPKQITLTNVTNPTLSGTNVTVYTRISLYDNSTFSNSGGAGNQIVHSGVVAAAITRQLTVSGRVQERLEFCVGAFDDTDTVPGSCTSGFPTDTDIAIGTIDPGAVYATPVTNTATNLANDRYGGAMVNTNASGGVTVTYFPEPATSVTGSDTHQLRSFRVVPTDCNALATTLTDQCFQSASSSGESITAGTEKFGMSVACFNTDSGTTDNFDPTNGATWNAAYDGDNDDEDTGGDDCENEATGSYTWGFDDSGTPDNIVTSTSVVDDELIKLRYGATASATTPEGSYLVILTYIATPTF